MMTKRLGLCAALLYLTVTAAAESGRDWPVWCGDNGSMKYSPLTQIDKMNVQTLEIVWRWKTGEQPVPERGTVPGEFEATPLAIDDVLYVSTPYNRVVALDATSGKELWSYDPRAYEGGQPLRPGGFVHRGVAAWGDGRQRRIFVGVRGRLVALDAATGKPVPAFGKAGEVDTLEGLDWPVKPGHSENTSPPVVYKNLVIIGNSVSDSLIYPKPPPGDVQAFDARTGKRVWRFRPMPQPGELGSSTWPEGSAKTFGHVNVWAPMSLDEKRGLLYMPVSTGHNDFYGGLRKGDNLFADSLVCLDANTGRRVWHFQTVHHGLWDFDGVMSPTLGTITVNGRRIDAVAATSKTGFTYVFDRVTGKPVWPIEERPVPQSEVPGEQTSATQPFPTKPPPYAQQGFTEDDVVDFTPELKAQALEALKPYRFGPIFSPPSLEGTLTAPGVQGGANWGGSAFDPETGLLYVRATNWPNLSGISKPEPDKDGVGWAKSRVSMPTVAGGVPVHKPPYGVLTALDLNKGDLVWQVPQGDTPGIRNLPALKDLNLPALGAVGHSGPMVTRGGLVFVAGGGHTLQAFDKATGKIVWEYDLGVEAESIPMTFQTRAGRQFLVLAVGLRTEASLVAFALPAATRISEK